MNEKLLTIIKESGRKVLIWGASYKTDNIVKEFKDNKIEIAGYIDKDAKKIKKYNDYSCFDREVITTDNFFVYVGLQGFYEDIIDYLNGYGYEELKTFLYPSRQIKIHNCTSYNDDYGNIWENSGGVECTGILSNGSKIVIGDNCIISASTVINAFNGSELIIGDNVIIGDKCNIAVDNKSKIIIENLCKFEDSCEVSAKCDSIVILEYNCIIKNNTIIRSQKESFVKCGCNFLNTRQCYIAAVYSASVEIGNNCSSGEHLNILALHGNISIEDDCMISRFVTIRSGNGHNLFDIDKGENINLKENRNVKIKKHVWLGMFSTVMSGAVIGSGSMIGAHTMIIKEYPNNSCVVGIPGKVIKKIAWRKEEEYLFESYSDFKEFDFTDE